MYTEIHNQLIEKEAGHTKIGTVGIFFFFLNAQNHRKKSLREHTPNC